MFYAQVVELVDTPVLEAGAEMRASSSLALGTKLNCRHSGVTPYWVSGIISIGFSANQYYDICGVILDSYLPMGRMLLCT